MRKMKTLLILALSLFVLLLTNAYADEVFLAVNLFSYNNVFDPIAFPNSNLLIKQNMQLAAIISPAPYPVYFHFDNPLTNFAMIHIPTWDNLPIYQTGSLYIGGFPFTNDAWKYSQNASFFIDSITTNGIYDSGEPFNSISPRPTGTYNYLNAAQNVQISGGIYPTITWESVTGADNYRVGIVGFDANGNPNMSNLNFITGFLDSTSTSYIYSGSPLQYGQSYAFFVEARDYLVYDPSNPLVNVANQSRYLTEYTPVPEPSTMAFLGICVISLVGLRRWWKD